MKTLSQLATGLLAGLSLAITSPAILAAPTDAFNAVYTVSKSGLPLGDAHFSLKPGKQDGCYVYAGHAKPNALVHMFLGNIDDETRFCIVDGTVRPDYFRHHIDGKPGQSYTLEFDWSAMTVQYKSEKGDTKTYTLKPGAQDPMSLQIAARRWLASADADHTLPTQHTFTLADDDGLQTYTVHVSDAGNLKTPGGTFDTVKLARNGHHHHALTFRLARNADWIPVQVRRLQDGSTQYVLTVQSLSRSDSPGPEETR